MATIDILHEGYIRGAERPGDGGRVASTVALVRDEDAVIVIDPGLVRGPEAILDPLATLGVPPGSVTDVVFSHHHPDHTINAALLPAARFHDHWATYQGDLWLSRDAEGFRLSPSVALIRTPGHTAEDITTLVQAEEGLVAFTHLWSTANGPVEDPYAPDPSILHASRKRLLDLGPSTIVPGHGAPFTPSERTPR